MAGSFSRHFYAVFGLPTNVHPTERTTTTRPQPFQPSVYMFGVSASVDGFVHVPSCDPSRGHFPKVKHCPEGCVLDVEQDKV